MPMNPAITPQQYRIALQKLGLSIRGAGRVLGVTSRQSFRYAGGQTEIPDTIARLIRCYLRNGIPASDRQA